MGVLTDYFIADDQQLAHAFAGWFTVAHEPVETEATNPFTGGPQIMRNWPPKEPVGVGGNGGVADIRHLSHVQMKRIDHVKLATLYNLLTGVTLEQVLEDLCKPALIDPTSEETGFSEVPTALATSLRHPDDGALEELAKKWQQTEEMELDQFTVEDCLEVLQELRGLARKMEANQRMYLYWSL